MNDPAWPLAPGEMAERIRVFDWASTSLGPTHAWPQSLKTATDLLLRCCVPMVMLWGKDGVMLYNDAYAVFAGGRHPRLLGSKVREGWPEVADFNDNVMKIGLAGRTLAYKDQELTLYRNGRPEQVFMDLDYSPITSESGEPAGVLAVVIDTSERVAAEAAMRESEARYRTLFEAIDAGFCVLDVDLDGHGGRIDYRVVEANPAFYRNTGFPKSILGHWLRKATPDLEEHWYELYGRVASTGEPARFEQEAKVLGRWFDVHAFRMPGPPAGRVAVLFNDITSRRRSEERVRQLNDTLEQRIAEALAEREFLANIVETTDAQVQALDKNYRLLAINSSCLAEYERIYGRRPAVGQCIMELLADQPEQQAAAKEAWDRALGGEAFTQIGEFGNHEIERRVYEMKFEILRGLDGKQVGAFLMGRDITERVREQARLREAEEQLRQSQKMEAMGQLTGGVAHDFNNLLTPIIGSLDMLQRRGVGNERERRLIGGALQSAERAKVLVQRLLAFARRQPLQATNVDVGALVEGMASLIVSTLGATIDVSLEIDPDLPAAKADSNQIEMALLNLAVNARDAMPNGGQLRITARRDEGEASLQSDMLAPGAYVRLGVIDTGAGMDEATLRRAVEPFFSTKGVGHGTGLGLSMVHGLVAQLGGGMTIDSAPGQGTKVELWLPVSSEEDGAVRHQSSAGAGKVGRGAALLVDDDDLVRMSIADMLIDLGFEVTEARSGEEALQLMECGAMPDVLVTDHIMPGMSGGALAEAARTIQPELPILVVSAYAEVDGIAPNLPRLTKPFRNAELAESLAGLMPRTRAKHQTQA